MSVQPTTPARSVSSPSSNGLRYVGATSLTYSDGSESDVFQIVHSSADISSLSEEMVDRSATWAERYHTHPARANVIRAIGIPTDSIILEVGSGCGGVTRYLGEQGLLVDALEPMEARALVARERTRDLAGVEVLVGEISDLPKEPAYDLVVVVGVLEYVGLGTREVDPYIHFLAEIRSRLRPGGSLVLAIENKLGAKYIAGAPEDHTSQVFDSIEGYPRGERARTFSRAELIALMSEAGLAAETFAAFPDYKMTRTIFSPSRLSDAGRSLMKRLPTFPSPDWSLPRPRLASERLVWSEFVASDLADEVPNSFVVIAGRDGPSPLWPANRGAVYFSNEIRSPYATQTTVTSTAGQGEGEGSLEFSRHWLMRDQAPISSYGFSDGVDLVEALVAAPHQERTELLSRWMQLMVDETTVDGTPIELTVFVRADGTLTCTPAGLRSKQFGLSELDCIERGILWMGLEAARTTPPSRWPGATTVGDIVMHFAALTDARLSPDWLAQMIDREAILMSTISMVFPRPNSVGSWGHFLRVSLDRALADGELGPRIYEREKELAVQFEELQNSYRESQNLLAEAQKEVERLRTRPAWRLGTRRRS